MGWVRISDDFYDHEKFQGLTVLGDSVWVRGLAYANRNLTDGVLTARAARGLVDTSRLGIYTGTHSGRDATPQDGIDELLAADLWHGDGHGCPDCEQPGPGRYVIHDFLRYQPSRAEVQEKRAGGAERVRQWRQRKGTGARNSVTATVTHTVSNPVSTHHPNPNPNNTNRQANPSRSASGPEPVDNSALTGRAAALGGFDAGRIRNVLARVLGEIPDDDTVMAVAVGILGRASKPATDRTAYLLAALKNPETNVPALAYPTEAVSA